MEFTASLQHRARRRTTCVVWRAQVPRLVSAVRVRLLDTSRLNCCHAVVLHVECTPSPTGLLLCGSNDDFLLHYGFVPAGNLHDDFVLFDSIDAALQWHRISFPARVTSQTYARCPVASPPLWTTLKYGVPD